jgi:ABC-type transport system substrate-binding protein
VLQFWSIPIERDRQFDELMKRSLDSIGIRLEIHKERFAELIKLGNQCRIMMKTTAWIADYPDGDNFMQLLYGKNIYQSNNGCAVIPAFDTRYERTQRMPAGPERDQLYREMARIARTDAQQTSVGTRTVDTVFLTPGTDLAVFERGSYLKKLKGQGEIVRWASQHLNIDIGLAFRSDR